MTRCPRCPSGWYRAHAVLFTDFTVGRFRGLRAGMTRFASQRTSSSNSTAVISAWHAACNDRRAAVNVLGKTEEATRYGGGLELEDGWGAVFSGAIINVCWLRFDGRCKPRQAISVRSRSVKGSQRRAGSALSPGHAAAPKALTPRLASGVRRWQSWKTWRFNLALFSAD